MGISTYLTAPCSMRVVLERRWRHFPAMLLATSLSVDGLYALYWHFADPTALAMMRDANFLASLSIYGMAGVFWLYRGSLQELFSEIRGHFWRKIPSGK